MFFTAKMPGCSRYQDTDFLQLCSILFLSILTVQLWRNSLTFSFCKICHKVGVFASRLVSTYNVCVIPLCLVKASISKYRHKHWTTAHRAVHSRFRMARFLKVCQYDQLCRNSCYNQLRHYSCYNHPKDPHYPI